MGIQESIQKNLSFILAPRFITVAAASKDTDDEHRDANPDYVPKPLIYKDYALLKVLFELRMANKKRYKIQPFSWTKAKVPMDLSGLQDDDVIFVVAHGSHKGIYAMGPKGKEGTRRFVEDLLTADGNLKAKRKDKDIRIMLLSCRAGLGLHKAVARKLLNVLGRDVNVGGAVGFTFGSPRTYEGYNEVLIRGIPWLMEYPDLDEYKADPTLADRETSAREGKPISQAAKKTEIEKFKSEKDKIEKKFKEMVDKLTSTEINRALDEIEKKFAKEWRALMVLQHDLYRWAKDKSNLEFDMWYDDWIAEGYVWTTGSATTDAEVSAILAGDLPLINHAGTSVK